MIGINKARITRIRGKNLNAVLARIWDDKLIQGYIDHIAKTHQIRKAGK